MKYKIVTICLFLLFSVVAFTQNFSNKGTDFWITYPAHIDGLGSVMGIYITSDMNASGTVYVNGKSLPFIVSANAVTEKFIGSTAAADATNSYVYLSQTDNIKTDAAIHVISDNPVVVYAHIIHSARSGATLVLPSNVWGREYVVPSYKSYTTGTGKGYGTITVVAADTNTTVLITPIIPSSDGARIAGVAYPITLAKPGDVYQVQFQQNGDISGTTVQSISNGSGCKKIAVFSSTTWSAFGCSSANSGDNLFQQLFPTGAWGKSFLTAPSKTRTSDIFRVFVSDPTAVVTKTENGIATRLTGLFSNSYYEYVTGNASFIQSDKAASVVQYFTTMGCQTGTLLGDPEMIVINPIEQTINNITVFSAISSVINAKFPGQSQVTNCYLNIIIKTNAVPSFKINNLPPNSSFIAIPATSYSYLQEDVTTRSMTNPVQNLKADSNFIAIAYGFGNVESYGYNAGTNVVDLTQGIIIQNQYATTNAQATCTGTPISLEAKFSYQPSSILWDFGNNANISPNTVIGPLNNPAFDSTFTDPISGKLIYVYKLPGTYNFAATGTYPIKVTANNPTSDGCSGIQIITYNVQVFASPVINFKLKASGCATDSVYLTDLTTPGASTITQWIWDFGDQTIDNNQNPVKKYGVGGNYLIHLRAITDIGCFGDTTKTVELSALPDIKFGVKDSTCVDGVVTFNDFSTIAPGFGTITTWIWSYGDGVTDTVFTNASRTHIYNQVGTDTVFLNLITNTGCSEVTANYINIHPHPVPGFILPEVCLDDAAAQFADTSSISDGSQSQFTYAWNFNAGSPAVTLDPNPLTSKVINPSIKFKKSDNYLVALKVTSKDGCIAFLQKPFTVNGTKPNASFTVLQPTTLCSNDTIRIIDNSTVNFGSVTRLEIFWDNIGAPTADSIDENPMQGKIYTHLYPSFPKPSFKNYEIRFVAHSGNAFTCSKDSLYTITLHQSPNVQFTVLPGICNDTTTRQITEATEIGGVTPGSILFTGTGVSTSGMYTPQSVLPGNYPIKYLFTSLAGCKDSAFQPITVWPSPEAKWSISAPDCERNTITFTDASLPNFSNIADWYWNFGDGSIILNSGIPFTKTYASANSYSASLRVMTDSGCRSTFNSQTIKVNYLPVVNFILPVAICLPDGKGKFTDTTTIGDNSQLYFSYLWNFGDANDPSASTLQNPFHQYTVLGPYTVQLKVTSKDGCTDSVSQLLTQVYPQPKADFSAVPMTACVNDVIAFSDQSNSVTSSVTRWIWDLAEGFTFSTQNSSRQFKDSGTFTISLSIYNGQGCISDTALKEVTVYPYPKLTLGPGLVVLQGGVISIIPQYSYGTNLQYLWTPSTYLNSDTTAHPQASPPEDIRYKLTLTGIGNCTVYDSVTITVLKTPIIPNAFSPNGDGINDTWSIRYLNSYPGCTVDVYNRYGQAVFHSTGYNTGWDGRYNGILIPVGTYYYIINPKNGRQIMSGSVTIIR